MIVTAEPPPALQPPASPPAPHAGNGHHAGDWSPTARLMRFGVHTIMRASADVHVEGLDRIPRQGAAILAVNHLSALDIPVAFAVLPRPAVMLAKDELRHSHLWRWLLADVGGTIFVRRGEGDRAALERALDVLRNGGMVALGPEGHRNPSGLAAGRTGVAYLAARSGAPVIPMAAWGHERAAAAWRRLRRVPIEVRFGSPIVLDDGADGPALRRCTDAIMRSIAAQLPPEYRGVYGDV